MVRLTRRRTKMNQATRNRIVELQRVAREARYNHSLALKRLATAQRRQDDVKADEEYLLLGAWADTYQCAKEDLLDLQGA